jgi:hypothetical protein
VAVADGAVCFGIGGKARSEGLLLITVPHNIMLFVELKVTIVQKATVAGLLTSGLRSFQ